MSGSTRPLKELIVDQVEYISLLDGTLSEKEKTSLDQLKSNVQKIKNLKPENSIQMTERFLGAGLSSHN
jgi:hypothetical protein